MPLTARCTPQMDFPIPHLCKTWQGWELHVHLLLLLVYQGFRCSLLQWGLEEQQRALQRAMLVRWKDLPHSHWALWGCCPSVEPWDTGLRVSRLTLGVIPPLTAISLGRNHFCSHLPTHHPSGTHLLLRYWLSNFHSSFQRGQLLYFFKICCLHTPSIWG